MTNQSVAPLCFWHLPYIGEMIQFVHNIISTSFNPNCTLLYLQVGAMEPWPSDVQLFQPYEVTCLTLKSMIAPWQRAPQFLYVMLSSFTAWSFRLEALIQFPPFVQHQKQGINTL